ncbi:lymphocyte antigen 6D isoform X2 [Electrophorus electricus]|uniref:lymphocyte antigen 6D isoform X2 n=1 Tax=Electrophorus electricus TaxID=8005 RepID=UPI0015D00517|nr:lymphocyte antigen 6D isoform X2 [Electrophorus electricus]
MRTPLALLLLLIAVTTSEALKCHMCVATNEEECNQQGSTICPAHADACSTITGPNSVMKSCSYASFCEKAHMSHGDMKLECCFTDDCNGPRRAHSHGERNAATRLGLGPTGLLAVLLLRAAARVL